jgi:hypothetical protein
MAGSRVAVFLLDAQQQHRFLAWASLVGPQVALLHLRKGSKQVSDSTPCRCEIYQSGIAKEAIEATLTRTAVLRSAPPFAFLQSGSGAPVTEVSDPRIWSTDLEDVGRAIRDFVAAQAASDPVKVPKPVAVASAGTDSAEAVHAAPYSAAQGAAWAPWWCKLFRAAPGC